MHEPTNEPTYVCPSDALTDVDVGRVAELLVYRDHTSGSGRKLFDEAFDFLKGSLGMDDDKEMMEYVRCHLAVCSSCKEEVQAEVAIWRFIIENVDIIIASFSGND